jgi:hypothetical protein
MHKGECICAAAVCVCVRAYVCTYVLYGCACASKIGAFAADDNLVCSCALLNVSVNHKSSCMFLVSIGLVIHTEYIPVLQPP